MARVIMVASGKGGTGKSTVAKALAKRLGIIYVDTGALYRTIGLYVKNKGFDKFDEAYEKGIEGRVICSFVVNSDGSISNIQILRGVEKSLNNEAVRIISKMPDWVPGKIDGQNVPVRVIHPIVFRK